jgi:uncharacterized protein (TIGR02646 family)
MKRIIKGKEPPCLLIHRKTSGATYENYHPKENLKNSLLQEQGYLCCYCLKRISLDCMEIEHFKPQSKSPGSQLDYSNLLASCQGNRGQPKRLQHCNARKSEEEITLNPADSIKNCEDFLHYSSSGKITSEDVQIDSELNDILNLNLDTIVKNRKAALDIIVFQLNKKFKHKEWSKEEIKSKLREWQVKNSQGKYQEYFHYVIWYLTKRL